MTAPLGVAVAAIFVWLGMVLAISFIEAPLKFRAPGITLALGLGIGRLVFRALNAAELLLGVAVAIALWCEPPSARVVGAFAVVLVVLAIQLIAVRPVLTRRSDSVLAGDSCPAVAWPLRVRRIGTDQSHRPGGDGHPAAGRMTQR